MIRIRASYNAVRLTLSTGCSITDSKYWDNKAQLVSNDYVGPKGETAIDINNELRNAVDQMEMSFRYFEAMDVIPTIDQLKEKYLERIKGITPQKPSEPKKERVNREPNFFKVFDLFVSECGVKRAWTKATYEKMAALKEDLLAFRSNLKFSSLNESTLSSFVVYLRDEKQLKTPRKAKGEREDYDNDDVVGLLNSSIEKKLGYLKWFLNWATLKGYNANLDYKIFKPNLKQTQRRVIYLTVEELNTLMNLTFDDATAYLEPVRDVFLFCCFSGLRYSDASNLRRHDINGDRIEVTTVKTADSIVIELNDITKEILEKYQPIIFPDNKALPSLQNQNFNRDLKILCKLAGMNEKIRVTTYKGNERKDEVKEKWELITSHCGRRTFIVNSLSMGITPNVTMAWTGHSDYRSMKPYIAIVDKIKADEMTKFNNIIKKK